MNTEEKSLTDRLKEIEAITVSLKKLNVILEGLEKINVLDKKAIDSIIFQIISENNINTMIEKISELETENKSLNDKVKSLEDKIFTLESNKLPYPSWPTFPDIYKYNDSWKHRWQYPWMPANPIMCDGTHSMPELVQSTDFYKRDVYL